MGPSTCRHTGLVCAGRDVFTGCDRAGGSSGSGSTGGSGCSLWGGLCGDGEDAEAGALAVGGEQDVGYVPSGLGREVEKPN
ncbi:hypothetical protein GCM10010508_42070 [Streptomyces naganishii JCM 4654]|uniref:Uncharacterized protein n=1 Tax=Streptomyces naganishii JCM 4654 TaxID=1306179 RepID=A0A918Y5G2_9ACTN|nr:hypothetical protein GCM10010508_42070 [Streptomyces naganishii JCM 4654]